MLRRNPVRGVLVLLAAAALLISGCQGESNTSESVSSSPPPRSVTDYPVIWLPTPALDLNSPDGTFARAYGESIYRSQWLGWDGVAPGFQEAYDPMLPFADYDGLPLGYQRDARRRVGPHVSYMWAAPFPEPDPAEKDETGATGDRWDPRWAGWRSVFTRRSPCPRGSLPRRWKSSPIGATVQRRPPISRAHGRCRAAMSSADGMASTGFYRRSR